MLGESREGYGRVYILIGSEHLFRVAYHLYYEHWGIYSIGSLYYMANTERLHDQYFNHHHHPPPPLPHSLHTPPPPSKW